MAGSLREAEDEELSTPIIDVWDDILTLPVIGLMDEWVEGLERPP